VEYRVGALGEIGSYADWETAAGTNSKGAVIAKGVRLQAALGTASFVFQYSISLSSP
jgi:hypothetical protein